MSKAFTHEEVAEEPAIVAPRALLPAGTPNYVTARGLALLREELAALRPDAHAERRAQLEERIASAVLVEPAARPGDAVRFGATVTVGGGDGPRRYRIVGVDEADPASGLVAFTAPLARALLGRRVGEIVRLRAPRGDQELEITCIQCDGEPPPEP
jgi:transcription elongation factor GreB